MFVIFRQGQQQDGDKRTEQENNRERVEQHRERGRVKKQRDDMTEGLISGTT